MEFLYDSDDGMGFLNSIIASVYLLHRCGDMHDKAWVQPLEDKLVESPSLFTPGCWFQESNSVSQACTAGTWMTKPSFQSRIEYF